MLVLVTALVRFYLLGILELNGQVNIITGNHNERGLEWTECFAYIIFGQVIDNIKDTKRMFLITELILSFWFVIMGCCNLKDYRNT